MTDDHILKYQKMVCPKCNGDGLSAHGRERRGKAATKLAHLMGIACKKCDGRGFLRVAKTKKSSPESPDNCPRPGVREAEELQERSRRQKRQAG